MAPMRGIETRCFRSGDESAWLALRESAMSGQVAAGRSWTASDFLREFTAKAHFDPSRMWLAETTDAQGTQLAGAIYLCLESQPARKAASIQWLLVAPRYQRQGIGSHLLTLAESSAWHAGHRLLSLETLSIWQAACRFYESSGYSVASPA